MFPRRGGYGTGTPRGGRRRALIVVEVVYVVAVGVYVTYAVELLKRDADPDHEARTAREILIRDN